MTKALIASTLFCCLINPCFAEIEKIALPTNNGIELRWWPQISPPPMWIFDKNASYQNAIKLFLPSGQTFNSAETIIYARAVYKPRMPEAKSLDQFISLDIAQFKSQNPGIQVVATDSIINGDKQSLVSYKYYPKTNGNWEQVCFGEEGDYYILFAISSRSESGFNNNLEIFKTFVRSYVAKP